MEVFRMKKLIARITTIAMATFTMAIIAALPTSAIAYEQTAAPTAITEEVDSNDNSIMAVPAELPDPVPQQLGAGGGTPAAPASGSADADSAYEGVVDFFLTWIRRVGAIVAFLGAIVFAFGFKNDEDNKKDLGIKTMISGFLVWAVCGAVDLFNLFG